VKIVARMHERAQAMQRQVDRTHLMVRTGEVTQMVGTIVEARGPSVATGALCRIDTQAGPVIAEVVGFHSRGMHLLPLGPAVGIAAGSRVTIIEDAPTIPLSPSLLGRVLNANGMPIDDEGPILPEEFRTLDAPPPPPLGRQRINESLSTGVRAIDAFLTFGKGQRLGVFAGSGVGKSTLLGMLARHGAADVNVVGLIGERGREVLEFLERDLGPEGRKRSVVVVTTSDTPAPLRVRAALTTTVIAEYFRDQGLNVCLMMDSVTRVAMAQREIGLAIGEPSTTRGYTPSVFSLLPRFLERTGMGERGSITGIYTVLVEGDDLNEPVADAVRGILDGHVVLSRRLAERNHYPAIEVLSSVSRLMPVVASNEHRRLAGEARDLLSRLEASRDLRDVGAYVAGSNAVLDRALLIEDPLRDFLRQRVEEACPLAASVSMLGSILERASTDPSKG
jgi:flagellum-specific ATP synthase